MKIKIFNTALLLYIILLGLFVPLMDLEQVTAAFLVGMQTMALIVLMKEKFNWFELED